MVDAQGSGTRLQVHAMQPYLDAAPVHRGGPTRLPELQESVLGPATPELASDQEATRVMNHGETSIDPVAGVVHGDWGFKDVNTKELTHAIHPYPARLVPQVARKIIGSYPGENLNVWDPFCGSGTVLLEAMTHGHPSVGTDLNPFACLLARTKTTPLEAEDLTRWTETIEKRLQGTKADCKRKAYTPILEDFTLDVNRWWQPSAIRDLGFIREQLVEISHLGADHHLLDAFDVAFSWTVRHCSNQRRNEFKRYRRADEDLKDFKPDAVSSFLQRWRQVSGMISSLAESHPDAPKPQVEAADSSTFQPKAPVDLLVTSPPYGDHTTTVAYGQFSSLMMEWLPRVNSDWRHIDQDSVGGTTHKDRKETISPTLSKVVNKIEKVDKNRAQVVQNFFGDMRSCLENFYDTMAPSGHACFIIGDRTVRGVTVPNAQILTEEAMDVGFIHSETVSRRIFFKVGPYKVNPIGRSGKTQDTRAISREEIIILTAT